MIFKRQNGANYIEVFLKENEEIFTAKKLLIDQHPNYIIKTHKENNQLIYAASDAEKWMVLAVLIFVLIQYLIILTVHNLKRSLSEVLLSF